MQAKDRQIVLVRRRLHNITLVSDECRWRSGEKKNTEERGKYEITGSGVKGYRNVNLCLAKQLHQSDSNLIKLSGLLLKPSVKSLHKRTRRQE